MFGVDQAIDVEIEVEVNRVLHPHPWAEGLSWSSPVNVLPFGCLWKRGTFSAYTP